MAYSKLHSSIVNSSLWCADDSARILFITMLALADKDGIVYGSKSGITRAANLRPGTEETAWAVLLSPDPDSSDKIRAPQNDGRRIEPISGGYKMLNHEYYRNLRSDDDRREQNRLAQSRHRQRMSAKVSNGQQSSPCVTEVSLSRSISEAEALDQGVGAMTSETAPQPAKSSGARKARPAPSPEEIIKRYTSDTTYKGIDVAREYGKWQNWCALHHKQPTERRFVAWLNRIDPPVVGIVRPRNTDPNI